MNCTFTRYFIRFEALQPASPSGDPGPRHFTGWRNAKLPNSAVRPTKAVSSTRIVNLDDGTTLDVSALEDPSTPPRLPMLSSTCPGFVCYAEKSHPEVLPLVCSIKSAQQITGLVFKRFVGPELCGMTPGSVFHVAVMPCFDKKLEASRLVRQRYVLVFIACITFIRCTG